MGKDVYSYTDEDCINEEGYLVTLKTGRKVLLGDIQGLVEIEVENGNTSSIKAFRGADVEVYALTEGYSDDLQCIDDDSVKITGDLTEEELNECKDKAKVILECEAYEKYLND